MIDEARGSVSIRLESACPIGDAASSSASGLDVRAEATCAMVTASSR
jgi:hypothetical protein